MSTNEERRARKAEKRAANKAKRQQRHKNERLDTRGADAVVNDERDILGNNGPDDDLDTDGLFVGLDDVPVNEVPHEDEHVSEPGDDEFMPEPDDGEFVSEPEGNDFVPESEDGDAVVSQQDVSELESDDDEFVPETDYGNAVVSQQDAPESEFIPEPETEAEGSGMDSSVESEFVSEPDVEVPVELVSEPDDDEFVPESEDEGSVESGPEFVQEPDSMTRFEAGDENQADGNIVASQQSEDVPDDNTLGIDMDDPFGDMTEDQLDAELGDFEPEPEREVVENEPAEEPAEIGRACWGDRELLFV